MRQFIHLAATSTFVVLALALAPPQEAKAPSLTDAQKLEYAQQSNRLLSDQVEMLRAQRDAEAAQREMTALLDKWRVEGYVLNPQTLTYVKDAKKQEEAHADGRR